MGAKMVLLRSTPEPNPNGSYGQIEIGDGTFRGRFALEGCRPGHPFDGREGDSGEDTTGWYRSNRWMPVSEFAAALARNWWRESWADDYSDAEYAVLVRATATKTAEEYAATGPDDFPGLVEHYPQVAAEYPA